jgi:tetratricopeptide (TPR) repeat protein
VYGLVERNRLDDADRELEKIASLYPAMYASKRGELASVGGKRTEFILGKLEELRIDPEMVGPRNYLSFRFASIGLEREALTVSRTTWPYVFSILGRPLDALAKTQELMAKDPVNSFYRDFLGMALAAVGEYARAKPILEELWQRSGKTVTRGYVFTIIDATALIAIRQDAGEAAGVEELLAAIKENVRRYRQAGIIRAEIHQSPDYEEGIYAYLSGEREKGLALIAKAAEDGFFIPPNEAYLQMLYDDPDFAPIMSGQQDRQSRERNRFLNIVCNDNPYAAVWQPAEGTCERFAAEGVVIEP